MGISVNGVEITDAAIEEELPHHRQAANPLKQALHELVLRTALLQEADRLGIAGEDDDARIEEPLHGRIDDGIGIFGRFVLGHGPGSR